jgi:hypothetical protein
LVEGHLTWIDIKNTGEQDLHRFWKVLDSDQSVVWHDYSTDYGNTQDFITSFSSIGVLPGPVSVTSNKIDKLQLIQISELEDTQDLILQNWAWDRNQWISTESIILSSAISSQIESIMSNITVANYIFAIYTLSEIDANTGELVYHLISTRRLIDISNQSDTPAVIGTPVPTKTSVEIIQDFDPTSTHTPTIKVEATITPPTSILSPTSMPNQTRTISTSSIAGIVLGMLLTILIVGVVFFVSNYIRNR